MSSPLMYGPILHPNPIVEGAPQPDTHPLHDIYPKASLRRLSSYCYTCETKAFGIGILSHLYFGELSCKYCYRSFKSCAVFREEYPMQGRCRGTGDAHNGCRWVISSCKYLMYHTRKNLSIAYEVPPSRLKLDDVFRSASFYLRGVLPLRQMYPWKTAFQEIIEAGIGVDLSYLPPCLRRIKKGPTAACYPMDGPLMRPPGNKGHETTHSVKTHGTPCDENGSAAGPCDWDEGERGRTNRTEIDGSANRDSGVENRCKCEANRGRNGDGDNRYTNRQEDGIENRSRRIENGGETFKTESRYTKQETSVENRRRDMRNRYETGKTENNHTKQETGIENRHRTTENRAENTLETKLRKIANGEVIKEEENILKNTQTFGGNLETVEARGIENRTGREQTNSAVGDAARKMETVELENGIEKRDIMKVETGLENMEVIEVKVKKKKKKKIENIVIEEEEKKKKKIKPKGDLENEVETKRKKRKICGVETGENETQESEGKKMKIEMVTKEENYPIEHTEEGKKTKNKNKKKVKGKKIGKGMNKKKKTALKTKGKKKKTKAETTKEKKKKNKKKMKTNEETNKTENEHDEKKTKKKKKKKGITHENTVENSVANRDNRVTNSQGYPTTTSQHTPATTSQHTPATTSQHTPATTSQHNPATTSQTLATTSQHNPATTSQHNLATTSQHTPASTSETPVRKPRKYRTNIKRISEFIDYILLQKLGNPASCDSTLPDFNTSFENTLSCSSASFGTFVGGESQDARKPNPNFETAVLSGGDFENTLPETIANTTSLDPSRGKHAMPPSATPTSFKTSSLNANDAQTHPAEHQNTLPRIPPSSPDFKITLPYKPKTTAGEGDSSRVGSNTTTPARLKQGSGEVSNSSSDDDDDYKTPSPAKITLPKNDSRVLRDLLKSLYNPASDVNPVSATSPAKERVGKKREKLKSFYSLVSDMNPATEGDWGALDHPATPAKSEYPAGETRTHTMEEYEEAFNSVIEIDLASDDESRVSSPCNPADAAPPAVKSEAKGDIASTPPLTPAKHPTHPVKSEETLQGIEERVNTTANPARTHKSPSKRDRNPAGPLAEVDRGNTSALSNAASVYPAGTLTSPAEANVKKERMTRPTTPSDTLSNNPAGVNVKTERDTETIPDPATPDTLPPKPNTEIHIKLDRGNLSIFSSNTLPGASDTLQSGTGAHDTPGEMHFKIDRGSISIGHSSTLPDATLNPHADAQSRFTNLNFKIGNGNVTLDPTLDPSDTLPAPTGLPRGNTNPAVKMERDNAASDPAIAPITPATSSGESEVLIHFTIRL